MIISHFDHGTSLLTSLLISTSLLRSFPILHPQQSCRRGPGSCSSHVGNSAVAHQEPGLSPHSGPPPISPFALASTGHLWPLSWATWAPQQQQLLLLSMRPQHPAQRLVESKAGARLSYMWSTKAVFWGQLEKTFISINTSSVRSFVLLLS